MDLFSRCWFQQLLTNRLPLSNLPYTAFPPLSHIFLLFFFLSLKDSEHCACDGDAGRNCGRCLEWAIRISADVACSHDGWTGKPALRPLYIATCKKTQKNTLVVVWYYPWCGRIREYARSAFNIHGCGRIRGREGERDSRVFFFLGGRASCCISTN